jgi:hypothetical protein
LGGFNKAGNGCVNRSGLPDRALPEKMVRSAPGKCETGRNHRLQRSKCPCAADKTTGLWKQCRKISPDPARLQNRRCCFAQQTSSPAVPHASALPADGDEPVGRKLNNRNCPRNCSPELRQRKSRRSETEPGPCRALLAKSNCPCRVLNSYHLVVYKIENRASI